MEGGRPESEKERGEEGAGRTQSSSQNCRRVKEQRGSDGGVNRNWEEGWGADLWVMQQNWSGKDGGGSSAVRAKERSHGGRMSAGYPRKYD